MSLSCIRRNAIRSRILPLLPLLPLLILSGQAEAVTAMQENCSKTVSLHAMLTRARMQCGFKETLDKKLDSTVRSCSHVIDQKIFKGSAIRGFVAFDKIEKDRGHDAACAAIMKQNSALFSH